MNYKQRICYNKHGEMKAHAEVIFLYSKTLDFGTLCQIDTNSIFETLTKNELSRFEIKELRTGDREDPKLDF